ncbi:NAD(P)/FAD-dependent oxidoreductase [Elioraea sp.]|uniref:FAD/NAD(P)-dependent oxidoreductase n=1 Tax=Elioraea sp. TaxID=2185103 RepID=UPI003F6F6754
MTEPPLAVDLAVIGGGPAGASAAIEARRLGLSVALIDENAAAGGQIYRAPSWGDGERPVHPDRAAGERLREDLARSAATLLLGHKAWHVAPGGRISTVGAAGARAIEAAALVLATGTSERVMPVPGITLPGVIGLAAATIALKAHAVVPPSPTVVAGVGPLLYAVAAGLLKSGGRVAAVVDLARPGDWARSLPALASRPDLLRQGAGWVAALWRAGVTLRFGCAVTAIHGDCGVTEVEIRPVDQAWAPRSDAAAATFAAASVAIGHGLVPATEAARLLGVPHHYRAGRGGWVPRVAADRSTEISGVYIAGDCAGISGAAAATLAGRLAALSAARDLGHLSAARWDADSAPIRAALSRAERFGWAISRLMTLRPGLVDAITPETVVCRCEDVTRARIEDAARRGAVHVNQVKSTTRCGMGPCQGRMCGEAAAELVALAARVPREAAGIWTARTPLRTMSLASLLGDYTYDDIPRPPPLPG